MKRVKLDLYEVKPGLLFQEDVLEMALDNVETALFFAKVYELQAWEVSNLLYKLFGSNDIVAALTAEGGVHSTDLQDFIVSLGYEYLIERGDVQFEEGPPKAEVLPEVWKQMQVDVADSIKQVAEKLKDVVGHMPGKEGQMLFRSMMALNAKRPVIGDHRAVIQHKRAPQNLVVLDVSGSMSEPTIATIVDDVVALSWEANAHLAIVSNTCTVWAPGEFSSKAVLDAADFGGTHYETLSHLLDMDWGVVVSIADYDSSLSSKRALADCTGSIELLLDISLVNRPTFLAECLGQKATEVRALLIASNDACLT